MTHEREFDRSHSHATSHAREVDLAPNRDTRSAQLDAPVHPIASGLVQRKARDANGVADDAEHAVATAAGGTGSALPETIQRKFEASLGADLSDVRVHTGAESASAASAVGARAYTTGQDIHFGAGQYDPSSAAGEHLLAHEVAHTVQQRGGSLHPGGRQYKLEVSSPGDHLEHEADRAADAMTAGRAAAISSAPLSAARAIQRDPNKAPANNEISDNDWKTSGGDAAVADIKAEIAAWEAFRSHPGNVSAMPGKKAGAAASKILDIQFRVGHAYVRQKLGELNTAILTEMRSINNIDCFKLQDLVPGVRYLKPQHRYEMTVHANESKIVDKLMKKMKVSTVTVKYTNSFGWTWSQNLTGSLVEISAGLKLGLGDKKLKGGVDAGRASLDVDGTAVARPIDYWGPENLAGATRVTKGPTGSAKVPVGNAKFQTGKLIDLMGTGGHGGPLQFENFDATAKSSLGGGGKGELSITLATLQGGVVALQGAAAFDTGKISPHVKTDMYLWSGAIDDFATGESKLPIPPDKVNAMLAIPRKEIELKLERLKDVQPILKEQFGIDEKAPKLIIKVIGYASRKWAAVGKDDNARLKLNQDLSQRRADAVAGTVKQTFGPNHEYTVTARGASVMMPGDTTPTPEVNDKGVNQSKAFDDAKGGVQHQGNSAQFAEQHYGRAANEPEDRRVEVTIQWIAHTVEWTGGGGRPPPPPPPPPPPGPPKNKKKKNNKYKKY
jgi:outer membrane protein OmpA-like peptidoglycan-associated protein